MRKLLFLLRAPAFLGLITVDINFSCSIEFDFRLISFGLIIELSEKKELLEFVWASNSIEHNMMDCGSKLVRFFGIPQLAENSRSILFH